MFTHSRLFGELVFCAAIIWLTNSVLVASLCNSCALLPVEDSRSVGSVLLFCCKTSAAGKKIGSLHQTSLAWCGENYLLVCAEPLKTNRLPYMRNVSCSCMACMTTVGTNREIKCMMKCNEKMGTLSINLVNEWYWGDLINTLSIGRQQAIASQRGVIVMLIGKGIKRQLECGVCRSYWMIAQCFMNREGAR